MTIKLKPRINFITGVNGSGKSAVLVAITVGLAGKASFTGRGACARCARVRAFRFRHQRNVARGAAAGTSFKSFVREGANEAIVTLRLRNRGADAFRRDEFGDSITIQRSIKREGASKYKLKAANGRVISEKADDVKNICDAFNIQVSRNLAARARAEQQQQIDNPCAILMQDTSREYLTTGSEREKYKFRRSSSFSFRLFSSLTNQTSWRRFFMQATQMQLTEQEYNATLDKLQLVDETIKRQEAQLPGALRFRILSRPQLCSQCSRRPTRISSSSTKTNCICRR